MARPILLLDDSDIIQAGDYVRQLELFYEGQSDYLATTSTYGGSPINRLRWIEVERSCPAWIGKTVGEFRGKMLEMERPHQPMPDHEFVRGDLPTNHVLGETSHEKYLRVHRHFTFPFGKYKGVRATSIKSSDPGYYFWAVDKGIVPYEVWQSLDEFC